MTWRGAPPGGRLGWGRWGATRLGSGLGTAPGRTAVGAMGVGPGRGETMGWRPAAATGAGLGRGLGAIAGARSCANNKEGNSSKNPTGTGRRIGKPLARPQLQSVIERCGEWGQGFKRHLLKGNLASSSNSARTLYCLRFSDGSGCAINIEPWKIATSEVARYRLGQL